MKIVIFGANGKIGRLVVAEALRRGHSVRAFVHNHSDIADDSNLSIFKGDIYDVDSCRNAIKGCEAVVSTLGSWGTPKKDVVSTAMENIIPIMQSMKINKIVTLTGADSEASNDKRGLAHKLSRPLLATIAGKILADGEKHINLLENSGLNWSVVRSPIMTNYGQASNFKLTEDRPMPWQTINRKSVAIAMVNLLEATESELKAPYIVRK